MSVIGFKEWRLSPACDWLEQKWCWATRRDVTSTRQRECSVTNPAVAWQRTAALITRTGPRVGPKEVLLKKKKKMQIVFSTFFFLKDMLRGALPPLMPVSHPTVTQLPTAASVQQYAGMFCNYNNSRSGPFWPRTLCVAFENGAFSRRLFHSDKSCSLLFVSLTCLHCISHCPKEKQY